MEFNSLNKLFGTNNPNIWTILRTIQLDEYKIRLSKKAIIKNTTKQTLLRRAYTLYTRTYIYNIMKVINT